MRRKILFLFACILVVGPLPSFAVPDTTKRSTGSSKPILGGESIFIELIGKSYLYSLNYEFPPFDSTSHRLALGVSYLPVYQHQFFFSFTYKYEIVNIKDRAHFFLGLGMTNIFSIRNSGWYKDLDDDVKQRNITAGGGTFAYTPPYFLNVHVPVEIRFNVSEKIYLSGMYSPFYETKFVTFYSRLVPFWGGIKIGYHL